jgi:S1-C subfamily serine protease
MTPEDPHQKKFDKTWYEQQFRQASKLASQIAASPYNDGPAPGGIRISSIAPESALKRIGLKVGDVIRDVDGQTVNTTQEFLQMLSSLPIGRSTMRIARKSGNVADPIYINLQ